MNPAARIPALFDEPALRTAGAVPSLARVAGVLGGCRVDLGREARAQAAVAVAFEVAFGGDAVSREHMLAPGDRPDFLLFGSIVVELKGPRHRAPSVLRQLARYAAHPCVTGLVLASARAMHMPPTVAGVPLVVVSLGRAWL